MANLLQDIRFSLRGYRKNPVFALVMITSIGLAIGVNTTVYTWMESLIFNPYPVVKDADRLVAINTANQDGSGAGSLPISYPTYLDWRDAAQSFDGMFVESLIRLNMRTEGQSSGEPVWGELVSTNYFDVIGVQATLGRTFSPEEEKAAAPVAVISHSLWQRKLGGDRSISGRHLSLNGINVSVIGVAPPDFNGVLVGYGFDLWIPVTLQPLLTQGGNRLINRGERWLQGTARLKDGVTVAQANAEMQTLARQISQANGEFPVSTAVVRLTRERFAGSLLYPLFVILLFVTGLVLLIACANVANLLLARATSRQKEIGIRLAIGATRSRIVRHLLLESFLLSVLGGVLGLLLALWAKDILTIFIPPTPQPVATAITLSPRVIAFASLLVMLTTIVFGLAPALRSSRVDLVPVLKNEDRGVGASRSKLRSTLVVAQLALSLVAIVCAGLFLRSLQSGKAMDLGFADPEHVLLVATDLNVAGLKEAGGLSRWTACWSRPRLCRASPPPVSLRWSLWVSAATAIAGQG
ncbi:MAG TPA: ABC transporter permease [Blastocatellia bacterium]|nr:ABC transporter permease [Blastocatellia bacterium]